jgi:AraC-like DNA-binding protein
MEVEGRGRIVVWPGGSLWVLEAVRETGRTDFHAHHAIQITFALEGDFELRTTDERLTGPAVAVAPDARHIFQAHGMVAFLFVEPESDAGRSIRERFPDGRSLMSVSNERIAPELAALKTAITGNGVEDRELVRTGCEILGAFTVPRTYVPNSRVDAMLAHAASGLDGQVSLASAASAACLSESRARHLFVEQTGLAFKSFLLWLRIQRAVEVYASGKSLTEAAHEAGFADSAHLSRTFRRHFGLPAAALRINKRQSERG